MVAELKRRVGEELERLSRVLMEEMDASLARAGGADADESASPERRELQERIRFLGQVTAGLVEADPAAITLDRAGFGSTVRVVDVDAGAELEYTLMAGELIDIEGGQVSLASPIGQALLGRRTGEIVEVELPHRRLRLRIRSVVTLPQLLGLARRKERRRRSAMA
ncbi:MAG TPA: GreA/GreB family elongation factor [Longimicrobiales bacterium]|nr:GreA/GreB family elongation factor [Longimicrobiales bacterium]